VYISRVLIKWAKVRIAIYSGEFACPLVFSFGAEKHVSLTIHKSILVGILGTFECGFVGTIVYMFIS
jgi:hypothetical protein